MSFFDALFSEFGTPALMEWSGETTGDPKVTYDYRGTAIVGVSAIVQDRQRFEEVNQETGVIFKVDTLVLIVTTHTDGINKGVPDPQLQSRWKVRDVWYTIDNREQDGIQAISDSHVRVKLIKRDSMKHISPQGIR